MFVVRRSEENPMLRPVFDSAWEGFATFNWCPVDFEGKTHVVYRAMSLADPIREGPPNLSTIGYASSKDGIHYSDRRELIVPTEPWEKYGCEDPRITRYGDDFYIFYTALSTYPFSPAGIRVALAKTKDFKTVTGKYLITPFTAKAMTLFPEPVNGKMTAILTVDPEQVPKKIAIVQFDREEDMFDQLWWKRWYENVNEHRIYPERTPNDQIEVGAPPIKTEHGWLLLYSMIENHFERGLTYQYVYGIEAVLLDLHDPRKIIGATKGPFITSLESYERAGAVNNVVFPSGTRVLGEKLEIYYGAADTTGCIAEVRLNDIVETLYSGTAQKRRFTRVGGPIIIPDKTHAWENKAVLNPAAVDLNGSVYILYRAMGEDNTSVVGLAVSKDAVTIDERLPEPIYVPRADFEQKRNPGGNSGCEDARITQIGERLHMLYTAYDGVNTPHVAATSIAVSDFVTRKWNWTVPQLISPLGVDDKDACVLPKKVQGKYALIHRIAHTICAHYFSGLDFEKEKAITCVHILGPRSGMWDSVKVGMAGPPIETEAGWLMLYHGISEVHNTYRIGAALLAKDDLTKVLGRTSDPFFEPEMVYEKEGIKGNVVFPCGSVVRDDTLYIYYGAADSVVGVAKITLGTVLKALT